MVLKSTSLQTGNMFDFGKSMREILRVDDPTSLMFSAPGLTHANTKIVVATHTHTHTYTHELKRVETL